MKNGGIGVGSASIVLVFAVLCFTVFSLITLLIAGNGKTLADAEAGLVIGYYEADVLAERIVAEIIAEGYAPETVLGIDVVSGWDFESGETTASFTCPISDLKELYVSLAILGDSYEILSWRMLDIGDWEVDDRLPVWQEPGDLELGDPMDVWLGFEQWAQD